MAYFAELVPKFPLVKRTCLLLCCLFSGYFIFGQADSSHLRISLLTCGPGEDLFTTWGHTALRVTDSSNKTDTVFNYGSFDFEAAGFYVKFAQGNMQYFVSTSSMDDFVYEYQYFKRGIIEQELNLNAAEKMKLAAALRENAKEGNKYYRYDFLYDNCSSRVRDMVAANTSNPIQYHIHQYKNDKTFWNLIHESLHKNQQPWSRLGIDILLGSGMDKRATLSQTMFLPEYLMVGFDSATLGAKNLVKSKRILLNQIYMPEKAWILPWMAFGILLVAIGCCSFIPAMQSPLLVFDFILFLATGLMGILLLLLWFGRIDTICSYNFNLLWAMPTHTIIAFLLNKKKAWLKTYWLVNSVLLLLLLLSWNWIPQELNTELIPFVLLLLLRSVIRYRKIDFIV